MAQASVSVMDDGHLLPMEAPEAVAALLGRKLQEARC